MGWEYILRLILFGVLHWILAFIMLNDLANRRRVMGGKKWIWAILILLVLIVGSFIYLLFHPQIFFGDDNDRK